MSNIKELIREYIELILNEGPVPLKAPQTEQQKDAFVKLLAWAGDKMSAPKEVINDAIDDALKKNDWSDAIDLLRDFYVMKGIKFQKHVS